MTSTIIGDFPANSWINVNYRDIAPVDGEETLLCCTAIKGPPRAGGDRECLHLRFPQPQITVGLVRRGACARLVPAQQGNCGQERRT